jgi:hypothetical protein
MTPAVAFGMIYDSPAQPAPALALTEFFMVTLPQNTVTSGLNAGWVGAKTGRIGLA